MADAGFDVIVIGAGAAGLMAAIHAAERDRGTISGGTRQEAIYPYAD